MKLVKTIFILLVIALGISFALLNAQSVPLHYLFAVKEISLALLLAFTLAVGVLLGVLFSIPPLFRLRRSNRQMKSRIKLFEKELETLRNIPLRDTH